MRKRKGTPQADWFGWSVNFVLGLIAGALLGFVASMETKAGRWLDVSLVPWFVTGTSLLAGGVCSIFGDELWQGEMYRTFEPQAPEASFLSRGLSIGIIVVGCALTAYAIGQNAGWV